MEDDLKKYLNEHREEFELDMPKDDMWSKINDDLRPEAKKKNNFHALRIAASILLIVGVGATTYSYFSETKDPLADADLTINTEEVVGSNQMSDISHDLAEVESFYAQKVNQQMDVLNQYDVDEDLINEVHSLKNEFEELKKEMGVGADQSRVVEAMIDNYRLRLILLEDLLEAVDNTNNKNTRNYERDI
ncbi:MAG: hypothetical protein ACI8XB_002326 [Patiriisocius sp.]|jgi:hypothetical protein